MDMGPLTICSGRSNFLSMNFLMCNTDHEKFLYEKAQNNIYMYILQKYIQPSKEK